LKIKRRDLLKSAGIAALGAAGCDAIKGPASCDTDPSSVYVERSHVQRFNMSGFRAPKINCLTSYKVGQIEVADRD